MRLWDGRELGSDGAGFRLVLAQPWSLRAVANARDDLRAGEAYLAGAIDVEGSMVAALRAVARLRETLTWRDRVDLATAALRMPAAPRDLDGGRARLQGRVHTRERDAAAVRHHYDVGNDFYRLVLDDAMVYSCAYFADEDAGVPPPDRDALDRAQRRKLELVCRKLDLRPGERFLDVGCGWGALVLHAARHYGVRALGVTLSERQAELAQERVSDAGLADRVRIEVRDYRDVDERFDAIASVGMVEHVGADMLDLYVRSLSERLAPGGRLLNHGITTGHRDLVRDFARQPDTFIGRYVFPDGALVPSHHMVRVLERGGFEVHDVEQLRRHYALTLQHWVGNLEADYARAAALVGETTARVWRAYLAGSVLGFESGDLGVVQILAARWDAALPLDRRRMVLSDVADR
ncbi:MAG TPA: cyclopropane-fatty-acyl-phospholipid synthase family protein [Egicoccus sp.]|nr:cyclopropane-fatty-acyl-phospholipid synthase family protein [Egicoccus sp.]HSK25078.1 cyclopropane-fatty-acyl-phospholipid synthase family protein [Egicoccus sp.]